LVRIERVLAALGVEEARLLDHAPSALQDPDLAHALYLDGLAHAS
jgi:hypothetical protein